MEEEYSLYKTKQRQELLEFMRKNTGQPLSVQQIYAYLQTGEKPVGLTTVYRYIDKLRREGKIRKYHLEGNPTPHYEYVEDSTEGLNFQCDKCGKIEHIACQNFLHTTAHMFEDHGIKVNTSKTIFYGECQECGNAPQDKKEGEPHV